MISLLYFLACLPSFAQAHNWLLYPQPRTPGKLYGGNSLELDNCENGDQSVPDSNYFSRGQRISAQHTYANHISGFVRYAILPIGQETDVAAMNDPANFLSIGCHTNNCGGRYNDMSEFEYMSPYNLPQQSGIQMDFNPGPQNGCNTSLLFPTHLEDGDYALHFQLYGMRGNFEGQTQGLPLYRNCANIRIAGGSELTQKPASKCAFEFHGGDRTLSKKTNVNEIQSSDLDTSQCSYWKLNSLNESTSYYNPSNDFWGMAEQGLPMVDDQALRHGPPAEVIACGGQVGSKGGSSINSSQSSINIDTNSTANALSANTSYSSSNETFFTSNTTLSQLDIAPQTQMKDVSLPDAGQVDVVEIDRKKMLSAKPGKSKHRKGKHNKAKQAKNEHAKAVRRRRVLFGKE